MRNDLTYVREKTTTTMNLSERSNKRLQKDLIKNKIYKYINFSN